MSTEIDAARLLTERAAAAKDAGEHRDASLRPGQALRVGGRRARDRARDADLRRLRVHQGLPVEKFYRDVKLCTIGEGTSEIQKLVIAQAAPLGSGACASPRSMSALTGRRAPSAEAACAARGPAGRPGDRPRDLGGRAGLRSSYRRSCARLFPSTGRARIVGITGPPGAGQVDARPAARAGVPPRRPHASASSRSTRPRPSPAARSSATASAWPRSTRTRASSSARWRRAAPSAASPARPATPWTCSTPPASTWSSSRRSASGQDEVDIVRAADTIAVVLVPGLGDDIQAIKAGILEIADVFVVNKAEREGADRAVAELAMMLDLSRARRVAAADREDVGADRRGRRRGGRRPRGARRATSRGSGGGRPAARASAPVRGCSRCWRSGSGAPSRPRAPEPDGLEEAARAIVAARARTRTRRRRASSRGSCGPRGDGAARMKALQDRPPRRRRRARSTRPWRSTGRSAWSRQRAPRGGARPAGPSPRSCRSARAASSCSSRRRTIRRSRSSSRAAARASTTSASRSTTSKRALAELPRKGFRLIHRTPVPGAGGKRVAFLHPEPPRVL